MKKIRKIMSEEDRTLQKTLVSMGYTDNYYHLVKLKNPSKIKKMLSFDDNIETSVKEYHKDLSKKLDFFNEILYYDIYKQIISRVLSKITNKKLHRSQQLHRFHEKTLRSSINPMRCSESTYNLVMEVYEIVKPIFDVLDNTEIFKIEE
jgi:hypothetical protein